MTAEGLSRVRGMSSASPLHLDAPTSIATAFATSQCHKLPRADVRNRQAERPSGDKVHDQIKLSRLLDRDIAGLRPAQNLVGQLGGAPEHTCEIWSIGHQASRLDGFSIFMHRR